MFLNIDNIFTLDYREGIILLYYTKIDDDAVVNFIFLNIGYFYTWLKRRWQSVRLQMRFDSETERKLSARKIRRSLKSAGSFCQTIYVTCVDHKSFDFISNGHGLWSKFRV